MLVCSSPLGLIDGRIRDWQLSASSTKLIDLGCHTRYARLHAIAGHSWCPAFNSSEEYLQIDFGVPTKVIIIECLMYLIINCSLSQITGILSQGRADGRQWTQSFFLTYSMDASHWIYYAGSDGGRKVFLGNTDSHSIHYNYLDEAVTTRFVRIELFEWHFYPSIRLEFLGCQECNEMISYPPRTLFSSSSSRIWSRERSCDPNEAFIDGDSGWCAKWSNQNQWLQLDVGPPAIIVGVITKGRG